MCVRAVCVRACVRVCMCARARVGVRVFAGERGHVCAIYIESLCVLEGVWGGRE